MPIRKTSINIDEDLWMEFGIYVLKKKKTTRKMGEALAEAIREYMKNNP